MSYIETLDIRRDLNENINISSKKLSKNYFIKPLDGIYITDIYRNINKYPNLILSLNLDIELDIDDDLVLDITNSRNLTIIDLR